MSKKMIIIDIMDETAELKIETKGFVGPKCVEESQFLKDALGPSMEMELKPVFYQKNKKEVTRVMKPLCG